jgi:uncharacterized membrane protein YdjX (TVP38/TMEM64 family)
VVINLSDSSRRFIPRDSSDLTFIEHAADVVADRQRARRWGTAGWVALAILTFGVVGWSVWSTGIWSSVASPERFQATIQGLGAWAPVAYVLAEIAQVVVPPIPGSVFPPVASAVFGPLPALLLTMTGTTIGSAIVFALARKWGRPLLERIVDASTIDRYARVISARGGLWLFVIMVLPFLPDDAVCAMMGSSAISFRRFLIVTTLGRLPSTLFGVYLTTGLMSISPAFSILAVATVLLALAVGFSKRDRVEGWLLRQVDVE